MNENAPSQRVEIDRDTDSPIPAFAIWIASQLLVLLACWLDVRITARSSAGCRLFADQMMSLAQVGVSSLIAPVLCKGWRQATVALAMSFPCSAAAAAFSGAGALICLRHFALIAVWLTALLGIVCTCRRVRCPSAAGQVLTLWVWGTLALYYLIADFRPASPWREWIRYISPLMWAW